METQEKELDSEDLFKRFYPKAYFLTGHLDGNNEEFYTISAQGGFILNRTQFNEFIRKLRPFYKVMNDKDIDKLNDFLDETTGTVGDYFERVKDSRIIRGFVYFLAGDKYVKIGKTKRLNSRTGFLEVKLPFDCMLIHSIETNDITKCEDHFHDMFDSKRSNGEWFNLDENDIQEVKKITTLNF